MCFFLVLGEVGTFGQVHLVDKTRHLSLIISVCVSQATSDFIDQCQYKDIYIHVYMLGGFVRMCVGLHVPRGFLLIDKQFAWFINHPGYIF